MLQVKDPESVQGVGVSKPWYLPAGKRFRCCLRIGFKLREPHRGGILVEI
jgi:hypothetical protein